MESKLKRMIDRNNLVKQKIDRNNIIEGSITSRTSEIKGEEEMVDEPKRSIPIMERCDVLVVGGGPAGLSAAIASSRVGSRKGLKTVIIEKYGCLGGVITTVGMETLGWYRYEGTEDSRGIGIEMEKVAEKMGGTMKWPYNDSECLDADFFKVVADRLMDENNVKTILHCYAVEVILDGNMIKGVITESKSGRKAIMAKRVIDCTGDADICHLAGAPYRILDNKERMATTTVFNCAGVDKKRFMEYVEKNKKTYKDWGDNWMTPNVNKEKDIYSPYLEEEFIKAKKDGLISADSNINGTWSSISDAGEATNLNLVHMKGYNSLDVKDLTLAEIEGRKQSLEAITAMKAKLPGFENSKLRNFGMTLGIRDTRKIIGEYNLTGEDVMDQARFWDVIGIFPEFIDGYNVLMLPTTGRYFHVPLRCTIPLKIDNLLAAGRCVAGDSLSHAAMRNMMACTVTGQGAGVAAMVSILTNSKVRYVNILEVQKELERQDVKLNIVTKLKSKL